MMAANICHDFGAGDDGGVEFLLQPFDLLDTDELEERRDGMERVRV